MRSFSVFIPLFLMFLLLSPAFGEGWSDQLTEPLQYPFGTIGTTRPVFIWQDIKKEKIKQPINYRITLFKQKEDVNLKTYTFTPQIFQKTFLVFRIPDTLGNGIYQYSIEKLISGKSAKDKYYYNLSYPILNEFILDSSEKKEIDNLPAEYLIRYLYLDKNNTINNGYNSIFFTIGGAAAFGIGMFFYLGYGNDMLVNLGSLVNLNLYLPDLINQIIYYTCFISSGVGLFSGGYYVYRYLEGRSRLSEIIKIGSKVSVNAGISKKNICAEASLKY